MYAPMFYLLRIKVGKLVFVCILRPRIKMEIHDTSSYAENNIVFGLISFRKYTGIKGTEIEC